MRVRNVLACVLVVMSAGWLYGQGGANGTILGTVTDNSGAVVANAKVDVTNVATGVTTHAETSSDGDFTAPYLAPGAYRVTVAGARIPKSCRRQHRAGRCAAGSSECHHEAGRGV